jgi:glycosyltransferase involved in cell wall biosynthesis
MKAIDYTSKVLMTADTIGGVWSYCMELCRLLSHIQFHLVTSGARLTNEQTTEVKTLQNVVLYETDYKLEWMEDAWCDIDQSGDLLLDLERQISPDLIHLNSYAYASLPFDAPKIVVAHSDVFSWWMAVKSQSPPAEWNVYYDRIKQGLEDTDLIIFPSESSRRVVRDIYRFTSDSIVIYNGRSKDLFYTREKRPYIFSMGRVWDEAKNIRLLVKAAEKVNYHTRIAGDQQFDGNIFRSGSGKAGFLGRLNNERIAAELSEASLYVLPAKYEPFGLSVLEAAYSHCALVLGDIPSLREIWLDAAVYADVNDDEMLAQCINVLMSDREQLQWYQDKALARAQLFSSGIMAEAYLNVYRRVNKHKTAFLKQHLFI